MRNNLLSTNKQPRQHCLTIHQYKAIKKIQLLERTIIMPDAEPKNTLEDRTLDLVREATIKGFAHGTKSGSEIAINHFQDGLKEIDKIMAEFVKKTHIQRKFRRQHLHTRHSEQQSTGHRLYPKTLENVHQIMDSFRQDQEKIQNATQEDNE